jgi:hypothetical protein
MKIGPFQITVGNSGPGTISPVDQAAIEKLRIEKEKLAIEAKFIARRWWQRVEVWVPALVAILIAAGFTFGLPTWLAHLKEENQKEELTQRLDTEIGHRLIFFRYCPG